MKTIETASDLFDWTNALLPDSDGRADIRLANWIWNNAPAIPCTWENHPIASLSHAEISAIAYQD